MNWYKAQDTFVAVLTDGTERIVAKGDALPGDHELVRRDIAARKKDRGTPLFTPLDQDEKGPKASG